MLPAHDTAQSAISKTGLLVAIEGIDGAGKTTQVVALKALLEKAHVPWVSTKEPTGGTWGLKIRSSAINGRMDPREELEAFLEDRREHVKSLLRPSLEEGKVVIVDRYYLSTVAYQGARGLDINELLAANSFAPAPDLLIILDVPPVLGLSRVRARGDTADLFEKEDELTLAREIFRGLTLPNTHLLDGTVSKDSITDSIAQLVFSRLGIPYPLSNSSDVSNLQPTPTLQEIFDQVMRTAESKRGLDIPSTCRLLAARARTTHDQSNHGALIGALRDLYIEQFVHTSLIDQTFPARIREEMDQYL